ncbi:5575_t:CDS:2, partial [Racocetra fulgida]
MGGDVVVGGYWLVEEKIGEGSFELIEVAHPQLPHEAEVLKLLKGASYVLLELLRGDLPWAGVTARNSRQGWAKMLKIKEEIPLEELYDGLPRGFMLYLQYTRSLQYDEEPDYNRLRKLLAGMEAEKVTREPLFFDDVCERPLSPRQRSIRSQSPLTIKSPRGGNDYDDDVAYASPPPSPFYKRKNFSWRTKNKDEINCFGTPERSNSLTISPSTNTTPYQKFNTVSSRSFSLPYRDPGYADNGYHPNGRDERRAKRPENIRKPPYVRRHSTKTPWNIVKDSNTQWEQDVQQKCENAWKNGQSWNDNNFDSQEINSVPSTPINEHGFWIDNADQEFQGFDGGLVGDSD